MNCAEFENIVVAVARNEVIDATQRMQGLAHVDACLRCARRLVMERILSDTVAGAIAEDTGKQAPAYVHKMLLQGCRERKIAVRERRRVWIWRGAAGTVAAMLLIGSAMMLRRVETPSPRGTEAPVEEPVIGVAYTNDEVTTDFIPLRFDPAPPGSTSVVRVQLPRTALLAFGLPLNEDRNGDLIQADLLLDENGLAQAVRFVE